MKRWMWLTEIVLLLIVLKVVWVTCADWNIGTAECEKEDVLARRDWLIEKVCVEPRQLLMNMPSGIGLQFQGEWALYSCSMLTQALANISELYPEEREKSVATTDSLIQIVKSDYIRLYDKIRWQEDPLESLEGESSHVSYLSHLGWMITNYKRIGGFSKYDNLLDSVCETINRRILASPNLNLPTYPDEPIYIPDMMVAIVALHKHGGYDSTVNRWLEKAKTEWIDPATGLLVSFLQEDEEKMPVKGSYSALNCYYLTLLDDKDFAKSQYECLKAHFRRGGLLPGLKEYHDRTPWLGLDIDAGPILFGLSPSGTAFTIGSATYFGDSGYRSQLLRTAEIAGHTVSFGGKRHYLLGNLAIVGEAITLAMRTNWRASS